MPLIQVVNDKCKGCELCISACPQKIIKLSVQMNSQGFRFAEVVDKPRCIGCKLCAIICPDLAIEVFSEGCQYEFYPY